MGNISTEFSSVYVAMIVTSIFGILLSFIWGLRNRNKIGYAVAPFSLFVNVLLYTMALKFEILTHHQNELWEGIIILHSLFFSIIMLIVMPPLTISIFKDEGDKKT